VRVSLNNGAIRVSPHYYDDESDLAALFAGLDAFSGGGSAAARPGLGLRGDDGQLFARTIL